MTVQFMNKNKRILQTFLGTVQTIYVVIGTMIVVESSQILIVLSQLLRHNFVGKNNFRFIIFLKLTKYYCNTSI